jgi:hypothetical protein
MEAVGLAASIATLAKISRKFVSLAKDVNNAAEDAENLLQVSHQVESILTMLERFLSDLAAIYDGIAPDFRDPLLQSIQLISKDLDDKAAQMMALATGTHRRLQWRALLGSKEDANKLKLRLFHTQTALNTVLEISNM